jgi:hypothetical protein
MSRAEAFLLTGVFAVFTLAYGALPWLAGGLFLDTHEGDSYHLLDILSRMLRGDVPHLDFVTPLGLLAFWPILVFMKAGFDTGMAMILAQWAVAICLLPVVAYAAVSRLSFKVALYFGIATLGLTLALSYGTATSGVGMSMHYNRWAWSVAFVVLLLVFVPAKGRVRPVLDGVLVGVLVAALMMLKVTYFVALAPVVALALASMHGRKGIAFAVLGGLVVALAVTVQYGIGFWFAYLSDLRLVSSTDIRPYVGTSFDQIVAGPKYITGTLVAVAAALVIRSVRQDLSGFAAFLLVLAFLYITYQNFGNDPQWLIFLPVLLLAVMPDPGDAKVLGVDAAKLGGLTVVAAFVVFFPSLFNIAMSPIKHLSYNTARFLPMVPEAAGHQDIFIRRDRAYMMTAQVYRDQEAGPWEKYAEEIGRRPMPEFQGVQFPHCEWMAGSRALLETLGADLAEADLPEGARLFTADLIAAYWFFAPVTPPKGSAPWYYGKLTGLQYTDYVMVPKCAFTTGVRNIVLGEMAASEATFTLVRDNDLMALFQVGGT